MGWDGQKGQTVDELLRELTQPRDSGRCLITSRTSYGLWFVWQFVADYDRHGKRLIALSLIENHNGYLMHKDLDETMHPYYYDVPVIFLEMATDFSTVGCSPAWRSEVLSRAGRSRFELLQGGA